MVDEFDNTNVPKTREDIIVDLAGLNYSPEEIAMYLQEDVNYFLEQYNIPESTIRKAFDLGILKTKAEIEMANLASAKGGNITQAQRHDKIIEQNRFEREKQRIIYGYD